ncbi:hypothetical protein Tco_0327513, partial [Tanacetum coccineum]
KRHVCGRSLDLVLLIHKVTPSDIQHSDAYSDLRVLQIAIRAKVIENQQSCLLLRQLSRTLLSTPTLSPAEPSGEPMMRRYMRD